MFFRGEPWREKTSLYRKGVWETTEADMGHTMAVEALMSLSRPFLARVGRPSP